MFCFVRSITSNRKNKQPRRNNATNRQQATEKRGGIVAQSGDQVEYCRVIKCAIHEQGIQRASASCRIDKTNTDEGGDGERRDDKGEDGKVESALRLDKRTTSTNHVSRLPPTQNPLEMKGNGQADRHIYDEDRAHGQSHILPPAAFPGVIHIYTSQETPKEARATKILTRRPKASENKRESTLDDFDRAPSSDRGDTAELRLK